VVAEGFKEVSVVCVIRDRATPGIVVIDVEIQNSGVPINITGENHMLKHLMFSIRAWSHAKMQKSVSNAERKDTSIDSLNTLQIFGSVN
jgi:hypothetical protein